MLFEVLDIKGIAYADESGRRQVVEKKKLIDKKMIDLGFFTLEGIKYLINNKRLSEDKSVKKGKDKMINLSKLNKDDLIVKATELDLSEYRNLVGLSKLELVSLIQSTIENQNKKMTQGSKK